MACRISKVKCERSPEAPSCARCSRLGLLCTSSGVKKRGAQNVKRDVARLGPAVRSLLASQASAPPSGPAGVLACSSYQFDGTPVEWCGPRCPAMIMSQIEGQAGRLALLQHWICIALRSGSCAVLGNVLLLAHLGGLSLNQVQALASDSSVVAPIETAVPTPAFIAEWQTLPTPVFTRTQVNGKIEFLPNKTFEQAVGNLTELIKKLGGPTKPGAPAASNELKPTVVSLAVSSTERPASAAGDSYALTTQDNGDPTESICASEVLLAQFIHPDDTMKFMQLNAALWSSLNGEDVRWPLRPPPSSPRPPLPLPRASPAASPCPTLQGASEMRAEITSPEFVRIKLAGSSEYTPCAIRGRIVWQPMTRRVWTVVDLAPRMLAPPQQTHLLYDDVAHLGPLQAEGMAAGAFRIHTAAPIAAVVPMTATQMVAPAPTIAAAPTVAVAPTVMAMGPTSATAAPITVAADDEDSGNGTDISLSMMEELALSTDELVALLHRGEEGDQDAFRRAASSDLTPTQPPTSTSHFHVREQLQALQALHSDGLLDEAVYRKRQEDLLRSI